MMGCTKHWRTAARRVQVRQRHVRRRRAHLGRGRHRTRLREIRDGRHTFRCNRLHRRWRHTFGLASSRFQLAWIDGRGRIAHCGEWSLDGVGLGLGCLGFFGCFGLSRRLGLFCCLGLSRCLGLFGCLGLSRRLGFFRCLGLSRRLGFFRCLGLFCRLGLSRCLGLFCRLGLSRRLGFFCCLGLSRCLGFSCRFGLSRCLGLFSCLGLSHRLGFSCLGLNILRFSPFGRRHDRNSRHLSGRHWRALLLRMRQLRRRATRRHRWRLRAHKDAIRINHGYGHRRGARHQLRGLRRRRRLGLLIGSSQLGVLTTRFVMRRFSRCRIRLRHWLL